MVRRILPVLILCAWSALLLTVGRAGAQSADASTLVASYRHVRRALDTPPLPATMLPALQQAPADYANRVLEVTAAVGGVMSVDGARTALLSVPGGTLSVRLPGVDGLAWIDSGRRLRALILIERQGNETSLSSLRLLAAVPEAEIALAEQEDARLAATRRVPLPSRSLGYTRFGRSSSAVSGAANAAFETGDGGEAPAALSPRARQIYDAYRKAVRSFNRRLSDGEVDRITTSILYFSDRCDIDPRLVVAMIIAESDFDINSTSRTGAMGLGQLMPATARGLGVTDAYDPVQNIGAAVQILRGHLDKYGGAPAQAGVIPVGQIALIMAAYNAGPGAVRRYHGVPPFRETRRYVARVQALYQRMCRPVQ